MKGITKEQEYFLYRFTRGTWMLNTESGLVDVIGTFNCSGQNLPDFLGIEFGKIKKDFNCSHNKLVSLEGAPKKIMGFFGCSNNELISLEGAPDEVGGFFFCYNNKLVSLYGSPKYVGGDFDCYNNQLVSLEDGPQEVGRSFDCSNNQLVSLEGGPKEVGLDFLCHNNQLVSLKDAPQKVLGDFICDPINLRDLDIDLLDKIYFYNNKKYFGLKDYITMIINGLDPEIYLKKMI